MKKKLFSLVILAVIIAIFSITNSHNSNDEKIIEGFLNEYFKQIHLNERDFAKIVESEENIKDFIENSNFDKYLTEKELSRLVLNREIPCKKFQNLSDNYNYKISKINKLDSNKYEVIIEFLGENTIDVRMIDTKDGRKIDYIDVAKLNEKLADFEN